MTCSPQDFNFYIFYGCLPPLWVTREIAGTTQPYTYILPSSVILQMSTNTKTQVNATASSKEKLLPGHMNKRRDLIVQRPNEMPSQCKAIYLQPSKAYL